MFGGNANVSVSSNIGWILSKVTAATTSASVGTTTGTTCAGGPALHISCTSTPS